MTTLEFEPVHSADAPTPPPLCNCGCGQVVTRANRVVLVVRATNPRVATARSWRFASKACCDTWWATPDGQALFRTYAPGSYPDCEDCLHYEIPAENVCGECGGPLDEEILACVTCGAVIAEPDQFKIRGHMRDGTMCARCAGTGEDRAAGLHDHDGPDDATAPVDRDLSVAVVLHTNTNRAGIAATIPFERPRTLNAWWDEPPTDEELLPEIPVLLQAIEVVP